MYITTKHLQILKFLNEHENITIKDLGSFLSLSNQHIKMYIDDIYFELFQKLPTKLKNDEIISKIYNFKNSKRILKKEQLFTKQQNIFYLLLTLIENNQFFLSKIADELGITKRNINNYIKEIEKILDLFHLKLDSSKKGIQLLGSDFNKRKLMYFLVFKFLIEREHLPSKLRSYCLTLLKIDDFHSLKKDIFSLLKLLNCERSIHHEASLLAFFIAFKSDTHLKIKDISIENSLKYCFAKYDKKFFLNVVTFLKNSSFKDIPTQNLNQLFNIINGFLYNISYEEDISKSIFKVRNIFAKYVGESIYSNKDFFLFITPWIQYCKIKELLFIDDFSFINLNLNYLSQSKVMSLTKDIKKHLPSFTIFEGVLLWYHFSQQACSKERNIFVFKYISFNIVDKIRAEIYKKHSIVIHNCIHSKELNNYLKNNHVDNIITIENFKVYEKNIKVKRLFLPLPNF